MLGRVTVIGCGLIGGSLVKCLRERNAAACISGIDREEVLVAARPFLHAWGTVGSSSAAQLVAESDLVVLAASVGAIVAGLPAVLDAIGTSAVVTDTGSVKKPMLEVAKRHRKGAQFCGGHPMAGREVSGFEAASPDLFERARWFLVPCAGPDGALAPDGKAVSAVTELVGTVGAQPSVVDPDAHDRAMAYVSHAPQLIASALYGVAADAGVLGDAGPGFRDVTRIAGGPTGMWRDVFAANRQRIAAALADIVAPLERVRTALADGSDAGIVAALELLEHAQIVRTSAVAPPRGRGGAS